MPKASQIIPDKNISMLLKGPFGMGKTIAAASFAIYGRVFIAYFDKKVPIELLTFYGKHRPELLDNIEYESYSSANANDFLNKLIGFVKDCRYSAVIVDSVTNMTSAAVNWSLGFRDPKGGKKDKVSGGAAVIPDFDEYKVETSLSTQALDICKTLPVFNIWIAHPLPQIKVEGTGNSMSVTKATSIVSYGNKVGAIVPGNFTEIYHFGRQMDRRIVWTDMIGDDFAKTAYDLPRNFDITNKLFAEVWKEHIDRAMNDLTTEVKNDNVRPFDPSSLTGKWKV